MTAPARVIETVLAPQFEGFAVECVAADRLPQVGPKLDLHSPQDRGERATFAHLPAQLDEVGLRARNPSPTLKERLGG